MRDLIIAAIALSVPAVAGTAPANAADEPPHTVVLRDGAVEIRDYAPMILAQVEVQGSMGRAGNTAFRPLAGYIFGGNTARDGNGNAEIAMTTPVTQTRSQEIAMTTPVTQTRSSDDLWQVAFVMPAEWTIETLPVPDDARVDLVEIPARRMATIRFSGGPNTERFERHTEELQAYIAEAGYEIVGEPVYARYDPPWVPTPFRRNEVMIEIAPS